MQDGSVIHPGPRLQMYLDPLKRTFMFDYSTQAVSCDRRVYWGRYRSLKRITEGEATYFGKCIHKFAEAFWLGADFSEAVDGYYKLARADDSPLVDDPDEKEVLRTVQRGFEICTLYFSHYASQRTKIQPFMLGGKPLVEVPFAFPLGIDDDGWTYIYCGRIDRVEQREQRYTWVVDTKTTTRFGKTYWNCLRPNDQITGYAAAVREITGKIPDFYAIDVVAFGKPRERVPKEIQAQGPQAVAEYKANVRFEQGPATRSPEDITDWWDNTFSEGIRLRKLWTDAGDNHLLWHKRTSQCTMYGSCDFRDICKTPVGFEPVLDTLYVVKPWSPFEHPNGEETEE